MTDGALLLTGKDSAFLKPGSNGSNCEMAIGGGRGGINGDGGKMFVKRHLSLPLSDPPPPPVSCPDDSRTRYDKKPHHAIASDGDGDGRL